MCSATIPTNQGHTAAPILPRLTMKPIALGRIRAATLYQSLALYPQCYFRQRQASKCKPEPVAADHPPCEEDRGMPFLCQKTVAPTADSYLGSHLDEQEKSRNPDYWFPERGHKDVAFGPGRHVFLWRDVLSLEDQLKADQQDQTHPYPQDIDAIPPPPDCQERRSYHWTKQRAGSIKSVEVIQWRCISRHARNIRIQASIDDCYAEAKWQHHDQYDLKREHQTESDHAKEEARHAQHQEASIPQSLNEKPAIEGSNKIANGLKEKEQTNRRFINAIIGTQTGYKDPQCSIV